MQYHQSQNGKESPNEKGLKRNHWWNVWYTGAVGCRKHVGIYLRCLSRVIKFSRVGIRDKRSLEDSESDAWCERAIALFQSYRYEEALQVYDNPPFKDRRCHCCGRHISDLNPFGGPGDPLVGDFTGALLVKGYRSIGSFDDDEENDDNDDTEAEKVFEEAQRCYEASGFDNPLDWIIDKYGKEEAIMIEFDMACRYSGYFTDSWECRDCMLLDDDEYFEKLRQWNK